VEHKNSQLSEMELELVGTLRELTSRCGEARSAQILVHVMKKYLRQITPIDADAMPEWFDEWFYNRVHELTQAGAEHETIREAEEALHEILGNEHWSVYLELDCAWHSLMVQRELAGFKVGLQLARDPVGTLLGPLGEV